MSEFHKLNSHLFYKNNIKTSNPISDVIEEEQDDFDYESQRK